MGFKVVNFTFICLLLTLCNSSQATTNKVDDILSKYPALNTNAIENRTEVGTCEETQKTLNKEGNGNAYFSLLRSTQNFIRKVSIFKDGVEKWVTQKEITNEYCDSYSENCTGNWSKVTIKRNVNTIYQVKIDSQTNLKNETYEANGITTIIDSDFPEDQESINKEKSYTRFTLDVSTIDGDSTYLLSSTVNGKTVNYDKNYASKIINSENDRTEYSWLVKPLINEDGSIEIENKVKCNSKITKEN